MAEDAVNHGVSTGASSGASDDAPLVEAFRRGDRHAFEVLVRRYQRPVWAVALRFAKDRDIAEDLAQRAFVQALENIGELKGGFKPWLMRIAVNLAKNHLRDHARLVREPEGGSDIPHDARLDETIDDERRRVRVRDAVGRLPDRQREVVMLRIDAQLAFAEVGEALGITENNAKVNFHHAVKKLKELLGGPDAGL